MNKASTPRLVRIRLQMAEQALRRTPLPKLLARLVIDRKLASIDFAAEGDPAPFYMPRPYQK